MMPRPHLLYMLTQFCIVTVLYRHSIDSLPLQYAVLFRCNSDAWQTRTLREQPKSINPSSFASALSLPASSRNKRSRETTGVSDACQQQRLSEMLNAGQPGFAHAPITKAVITLVVVTTVFGSIIGSQTRLTLRMPDVTDNLQIWRLLTHNFVFTTPGELLFGIVLLYYFRQFERQLGSSRFAAFALITVITYTAILATAQLLVPSFIPASGPYSLVFACVVFFFFETPKIYHFQVFGGLELSDKSFAYLLTLQLIFSSPPRSFLSCCAAVIAGIVYRLPGIRENAEMPDVLVSVCSRYILPLLGTTSHSTTSRRSRHFPNTFVSAPRRRGHVGILDQNGFTTISEANVETLVAMGFSRDQCVSALQRSHDDVQRATDMLLSAS